MGRNAIHNWEELLKEYLASEYVTKTDFAKAKGINPSLLRRNTVNWPNKGICKPGPKAQVKDKVSKKNSNNVTKKDVTKQSNTINKKRVTDKSNDTKKVTEKVIKKKNKKASKEAKVLIKNYLDKPKEQLTEKELLFCFYFVNKHQFNATKSYQEAFGCSYETANSEAYKLMVKPGIRAQIQRLKEIKYQSILVQADDLVEKYMRIAFSSITDFVEFGRVEVVIGTIKRKVFNVTSGKEESIEFPLTKIVNDVRFKESSEVDGSIIKSIKNGRDGASIELLDPQKAMEWLERYFMWSPMDRHKVAFDKAKLKIEQEKVNIERETANKGNNLTPEQGVKIVDDING
jgi:Phage terminase, small subunit